MTFHLAAPPEAYLAPAHLIDLEEPGIHAFVEERLSDCTDQEAARRVFEFVRDEVSHSWDIKSHRVTRSAAEALTFREGICYPKSHHQDAIEMYTTGLPQKLE